jgi:hypothetical protein
MPSQSFATIGKLAGNGIYSLQDFSIKSPTSETNVEKSHRYMLDPIQRNIWRTKNMSNPKMRHVLLDSDGVLKSFYNPVLVEDTVGEETTTVVVAILGDNLMERSYIKLDPSAFTDVVVALSSDLNATNMGLPKFPFSVTDLTEDHETDLKVTLARMQWNLDQYPHRAVPIILPKITALPQTYMAHNSHSVTNAFPEDSGEEETWKFHQPMREVLAYAHEKCGGHSCTSSGHPFIDEVNWLVGGIGADCVSAARDNLSESIYTQYDSVESSSALAKEAQEQMEEQFHALCSQELAALADDTATTTATAPGQPTIPFNIYGDNTAAISEMAKAFGLSMTGALDNQKEKGNAGERKIGIHHAKVQWSLLAAHEEIGAGGQMVVVPATLTKAMCTVIEFKDINMATETLRAGIQETVDILQAKHLRVGLLCDFEIATITSAFTRCFQKCAFHDVQMRACSNDLDQKMSSLSFLPVAHNNKWLRDMVSTETMKALEIFHDEDKEKRSVRTKLLFINGEQSEPVHIQQNIANLQVIWHFAFEEAEKGHMYKKLDEMLTLLLSKDGKKWLAADAIKMPHLPHSLACDVYGTVFAYYSLMVSNPSWTRKLKAAEVIPSKDNLQIADAACTHRYTYMWSAVGGHPGHYATPAETYSWFTQSTPRAPATSPGGLKRGVSFTEDHPPKRRQVTPTQQTGRGARTPLASSSDNITEEQKTLYKTRGFLECSSGKVPVFSHGFECFSGKELCRGFCFIGRYCGSKGCNKAHILGVNRITNSSDLDKLNLWVKSERAVTYVAGKGPNSAGQ